MDIYVGLLKGQLVLTGVMDLSSISKTYLLIHLSPCSLHLPEYGRFMYSLSI